MADDTDAQRDLLTRAVLAEAGGEPDQGQTGVAAVVLNRAHANSQPVSAVIAQPGAFEAWGDPARRAATMKIPTTDPNYQRAAANVDAALSGSDPTGGATNFLNPQLQAQLGRAQPSWAQGQGVAIGKHVFYGGSPGLTDAQLEAKLTGAPGGQSVPSTAPTPSQGAFAPGMSDAELEQAILQGPGTVPAPDAAAAKRQAFEAYANQKFPGWEPPPGAENYYTVPQGAPTDQVSPGYLVGQRHDSNGQPVGAALPISDRQTAGIFLLKQNGKYDPNAPAGSAGNPYAPIYGGNYPDQRGAWYIPVDDPTPRQVGDAELAYNKRRALESTPQGRAALSDARDTAASQYGDVNNATTGYAFPLQRGLNQFGSATDAAVNNIAANLGFGRGNAYGPQQAADAAYVADTERAAQEYNQRPRVWEGNAIAGSALEAIPLSEFGGSMLSKATSLGPIGSFAAGASDAGPLVRFASPVARNALLGGGVSGAQTYLDTGDPDASARNFLTGAGMGAGFGLGARALGASGRSIVGGPISDVRSQLAQTAADKYGIDLRSSQITGSPALRTLDEIAGSGAADVSQRAAFNAALTKTVGEDAPALTKPVMAQAKARIGQVFEDVASRTNLTADQQFQNDLAQIDSDAQGLPEERAVGKEIDKVFYAVNPAGQIDGSTYLALTRQGGAVERAQNSANATVARAGDALRQALDGALVRSASPDDVAALSTARQQYKAMKTLEPLAAKAGPDGLIDPGAVLPKVVGNYDNYAYTGTKPNDLGELAEIGSTFLKPGAGGYRSAAPWIKGGVGALGEAGAAGALFAHNPELAGALAVGSPFAASSVAGTVRGVVDLPPIQRSLLSTNYNRVLPATTEQHVAPVAADIGTNMLLQADRDRRAAKNKGANPLLSGAQ